MPYRDASKQREFQRRWMREYRKREKPKKAEIRDYLLALNAAGLNVGSGY